MKKILIFCMFFFFITASSVYSYEKPSLEEIEKVLHYYFHSNSPDLILRDYKLCKEIAFSGEKKAQCIKEADKNHKFVMDETAYLWMNFFKPKDEKQANILIQFMRDNRTRKIYALEIPGALRYRVWRKIPTNRVGNWKVNILCEGKDKDIPLVFFEYNVTDSPESLKKKETLRKISELEKRVSKIPISEYEKNLKIYEELLKLSPKEEKYQNKVKFYKDKIKKSKKNEAK